MAAINLIYIVPSSVIFNKESLPLFESMSGKDSSLLYSTLYLNHIEIIKSLPLKVELNLCFDEADKDNIAPEFVKYAAHNNYFKLNEFNMYIQQQLKALSQTTFPNILIIFSNSIGIRQNDLVKAINLLNNDDNNFVIGKSLNGKIVFIGFNYFNNKLFEEFSSFNISYERLLQIVNKLNYFLFTLDGFLKLDDLKDFKNLYKVLSLKESIEYCSHDIHERFTHLFIEYKELI